MKKLIALLLSIIVVGCCCGCQLAPPVCQELTKQVLLEQVNQDYNYQSAKEVNTAMQTFGLSAVLTVFSEQYTDVFGLKISSISKSQGSGGIIHYQDGTYYALTNYHVVQRDDYYSTQELYVVDYVGNRYTAYIYVNPQKNIECLSRNYDLALIYFNAPIGLFQLDFAQKNPAVGNEVCLAGSPSGVPNQINFSSIKSYINVELDDDSIQIDFEVPSYSINTAPGSSGGPLIDYNMDLVGVHFCGTSGAQGTVKREYGGAIPIEKVEEFLDIFCWTVIPDQPQTQVE